jgi:hypothetical protein
VNYCKYCCNAYVEPALDIDNDLGYRSVGDSVTDGYSMFIRSGDDKPTAIIVSHGSNDIIYYKMRYCPNCGRYLFENEKGKKRLIPWGDYDPPRVFSVHDVSRCHAVCFSLCCHAFSVFIVTLRDCHAVTLFNIFLKVGVFFCE